MGGRRSVALEPKVPKSNFLAWNRPFDHRAAGSVLHELREGRVAQAQSEAELTDAGMQAWRDRLDRSGMFARVVRVFDEGIDPDAAETREERFEFGLDCVLRGVAARLSEAIPGG